jgi:hypothetical protein
VPVEERARPVAAAHRPATPVAHAAAVLRRPSAPLVVLAAVVVAVFALILYLDRGVGFYFDEWNFVLERQGHSLGVFLRPHNEHISLVPVLVYKVLFNVVGLNHHWPYLAVLGVMHAALGVGVFLLARPRVGAWPAVMAATLVLFMGLAWQNILWAFQIGFVGSVLGGVLAWVALDRGGRRGDAFACLALLFATASSSLGVPMAIGVGAELLVAGRRRALWVPAVPVVLYGLWYLNYGVSTITSQGIVHAAPWAVSAVAAAAGALFGVGSNWGVAIAGLAAVGLGWRLGRLVPPSPRLIGVLVAGIVFWALTGAARSVFQPPVPPESSRYLTFGAIVLLLAAVELARGVVVPPPLLMYGAGVTLVAVALGLPALHDNAIGLRDMTATTDAELAAVDLSKDHVPAAYQPDSTTAPQVFAGRYVSAVRAYGSSPADTPRELATAWSGDRTRADRVLQEINARLTPAPPLRGGVPPKLDQATGPQTLRGGCVVVRPAAGAQAVAVAAVPAGGIAMRSLGGHGVEVKLRRFGDGFDNGPVGVVPPGRDQLLRLPADAAPQPYRVQVASAGPMALCGAG